MWNVKMLLVVAAGASLTACSGGQTAPAHPAAGAGRPPAPVVTVRVAPVRAEDVVYTSKSVGSLEADEMVQVTAEVEGAIRDVLFDEGARVSKSTVLCRIDPERYALEARRAQAAWERADADRRRAESELRRREALAAENLVSSEELTRARAEADRLAADASASKAAVEISQQNKRRSEVRAPRNGVIDTRTVSTGQFVKAGTVLATLVDVSRLRLRFKVSEAESLQAQKGGTVEFRVQGLGAAAHKATVYHVGQVADPATRQVEVLAWAKNPGPLKPGFYAEVTLATASHPNAVVIPEGAVQASEKGFITYVVEKGVARLRVVEIGLRTGTGVVEIVSGVKPGETVVIEGSDRLGDGVAVKVAGPEARKPS